MDAGTREHGSSVPGGNCLLKEVTTDLWTCDRPLRLAGAEFGSRMTIARLEDDKLWVHSPVAIDEELAREIEKRGTTAHVVAPNRFHHVNVASFMKRFPKARLYGAQGVPGDLPEVEFNVILGQYAPACWAGHLDQHLVRGMPRMNEVVFYHRVSRTVIVADLVFNVRNTSSLWSRIFFRLAGVYNRVSPSRFFRSMVQDRNLLRSSIDQILKWDFDRIILSHGEVVEHDAHALLEKAFCWVR